MIRLTRIRTEAAIPPGFRGAGRRQTETKLLEARRDHLVRLRSNPKASHGYPSAWWKAAKTTLRTESRGKCAYCEARAAAVAHCDVEHIRPKSEWWWLTCCWDNYCFACQLCNQKYKLDHFPISATRIAGPLVRPTTADRALAKLAGTLGPDPLDPAAIKRFATKIAGEAAELPDPYFDDPERLFAWEVRPSTGHVVVVPRTKTPKAKAALAAVDQYFGLNREELSELRFETYELLEIAKRTLLTPRIPPAERTATVTTVRRYLDGKRAFSGMCRYFVYDVWQLLERPA